MWLDVSWRYNLTHGICSRERMESMLTSWCLAWETDGEQVGQWVEVRKLFLDMLSLDMLRCLLDVLVEISSKWIEMWVWRSVREAWDYEFGSCQCIGSKFKGLVEITKRVNTDNRKEPRTDWAWSPITCRNCGQEEEPAKETLKQVIREVAGNPAEWDPSWDSFSRCVLYRSVDVNPFLVPSFSLFPSSLYPKVLKLSDGDAGFSLSWCYLVTSVGIW